MGRSTSAIISWRPTLFQESIPACCYGSDGVMLAVLTSGQCPYWWLPGKRLHTPNQWQEGVGSSFWAYCKYHHLNIEGCIYGLYIYIWAYRDNRKCKLLFKV